MFGSVLRSASSRAFAGAAAAALTGSAYGSGHMSQNDATTTQCEGEKPNPTVVGLLQDVARKVSNIETVLCGGANPASSKRPSKNGIDIVLGAQWGDEGKGKLVDMLSQVRL